MKIEIRCNQEESLTNLGFVKAMVESKCFTIEDLQEICSYLYVVSFMFGSKNRTEEKK